MFTRFQKSIFAVIIFYLFQFPVVSGALNEMSSPVDLNPHQASGIDFSYLGKIDVTPKRNISLTAGSMTFVADSCDSQNPGDPNGDGSANVGDAVFLISLICKGSDLPDPLANGDVNGDCRIDLNDAHYMLNYTFKGGPPPVECTCVEPEIIYSDCIWASDSCYSDPVVVTCPAGDVPFRVYVRDEFGYPIPDVAPFSIVLGSCDVMEGCLSDTTTFGYYYSEPSDENGIQTFFISTNGCDGDCVAHIASTDDFLPSVPVKALNRNDDFIVTSADYDSSACNDYNGDGEIDFHDIAIFNEHLGHSCDSLDFCDRFDCEFTMNPGSNLFPGDTTELQLELSNNNVASDCYIGYIELFATPYGDDTSGAEETPIDIIFVDTVLAPGHIAVVAVEYEIPPEGHGCVNVRFTTDCCDDPIVRRECFQSYEHCRVDSNVCYNMVIRLKRTPIMSARWYETIMPGWHLIKLHEPTYPLYEPDSVVFDICTPDLTSLGDSSAIVYQVFYDVIGVKSSLFQNRVVLTSRTGDVNNDCRVNVGDVVFIINYVFSKPGALAPDPLESADVNRDGAVNVGDAVYLINFVFKGGPPPGLLPPTP
ncbi:MAG: hypothetical protein GY841_22260 [FCB group bacterium]|nr:hypothetical protein [FCB group bacterium]